MSINVPNLRTIGGELDAANNKSVSETNFPNLETIEGNFVAYCSGFRTLPVNLKEIGGDAIISDLDAPSLLEDIKRAKRNGILKGNIFCLILKYD
ncbi:MAG: hypothetical protein WBD22_12110 [Pyrinomonadaceae bacterium]